MIQGVLFDMDGVLVDTEFFYEKRRRAYLEEQGFSYPEGVCCIGSNEKAIWRTLFPEDSLLREKMRRGYQAYRRMHPTPYRELCDDSLPGLFLDLRTRGMKIAIASSSEKKEITRFLDETGWEELIDFVISGEDCSAHKPDPEIYLRAMEAIGLSAETSVAVEDSTMGITAAKRAGLFVFALRPRHDEAIDQQDADVRLNRLRDLLDYLPPDCDPPVVTTRR